MSETGRAETTAFQGTVGVAGCGRMGLPMARAMLDAGVETYGFDVRPATEFGDFSARMVSDPAVFAAQCDVLFTIVRDTRQTDDVLFDAQAMVTGERRIKTLVVCSTLSPRYVRALRERVPDDIALVDAPMSGAAVAAEEKRLSFMLGGDPTDLDRLHPLFATMGTKFHRMGPFGAGMTAKVLNNFVAASSTVAVRQTLTWADQLGVDQDKLLSLMHDSSGQTWFGSNYDAIEFARDGYAPDNTIGILEKDVESTLDAVGVRGTLPDAIIDALKKMKDENAT